MGSGCRSCAKWQGAQLGTGIGRAVHEGLGSDTPQHPHPLHSTVEGAHRARSWLRIVARRSVVGRPRQINASQGSVRRSERKSRMTTTGSTSTGRGGDQRWSSLPRQVSSDGNGRSRLVQPEISRGDGFSFYAYSAKLLLFACSCASSDSASFL
jgi:hypothetical protein